MSITLEFPDGTKYWHPGPLDELMDKRSGRWLTTQGYMVRWYGMSAFYSILAQAEEKQVHRWDVDSWDVRKRGESEVTKLSRNGIIQFSRSLGHDVNGPWGPAIETEKLAIAPEQFIDDEYDYNFKEIYEGY